MLSAKISANQEIHFFCPSSSFCCCWVAPLCLLATPWTVAHQAPLSMGFSRQEYWSGLPCPPPGDLPHTGMETTSPALAGGIFTTEPPGKPIFYYSLHCVWPLSCVQLFATPWTVAHQAPLSMEFSRQEYCGGLPHSAPGDLPHPGMEPTSPALASGFFTTEPPGKPIFYYSLHCV